MQSGVQCPIGQSAVMRHRAAGHATLTPLRLPAPHGSRKRTQHIQPCLRTIHRPRGVQSEAACKSHGCWQQQHARDAPHLYAALAVHRHQARCFRAACPFAALRRKAQARDGGVMANTRRAHVACHAHKCRCRHNDYSTVRDWSLATCAFLHISPSSACCMANTACTAMLRTNRGGNEQAARALVAAGCGSRCSKSPRQHLHQRASGERGGGCKCAPSS